IAHAVPTHDLSADPEALLPCHVALERRLESRSDHLQETDRLEAAVAADDSAEFANTLEAFERQPGLGLVGVMHPYQGARFSGRAGAEMSPLEQQDASNPASGKVICGAGPVRTTAHHDHVGAPRHGNH